MSRRKAPPSPKRGRTRSGSASSSLSSRSSSSNSSSASSCSLWSSQGSSDSASHEHSSSHHNSRSNSSSSSSHDRRSETPPRRRRRLRRLRRQKLKKVVFQHFSTSAEPAAGDGVLGTAEEDTFPPVTAASSLQQELGEVAFQHFSASAAATAGGSVLGVTAATVASRPVPPSPPIRRPKSDWVCGVCSNLNSSQRQECFRCSTLYAQSLSAEPTSELKVLGVPHADTQAWAVQAALEAIIHQHLAADGAVEMGAPSVVALVADEKAATVYLRLGSVADATRALVFSRCSLSVVNTDDNSSVQCRMFFSSDNRTRDVVPVPPLASSATTPVMTGLAGLPEDLWPQHWTAPTTFESAQAEKGYLARMSTHWELLSTTQRAFYESSVKRALSGGASSVAHNPVSQVTSTAASSLVPSSLKVASTPAQELKKRLAEKKEALEMRAGEPKSSQEGSKPDAVSLLKQRLAQKKAERSSATTEPVAPATVTAKQATFFYGFPVLPSVKLESLPCSLSFEKVPASVAARIIPAFDARTI